MPTRRPARAARSGDATSAPGATGTGPVVAFVVLAFCLSWGVGAALAGLPVLAPDGVFIAGVPLAAVTVLAATEGRAGLRDLGRRFVRWRVAARWYVLVVVAPIMLVGTACALLPLVGGRGSDWTRLPSPTTTLVLLGVLLVLPVGAPVAEEIGWRGYALPRLLARRPAPVSAVALGGIWALWHLPLVLSDPVTREPVPFLLQIIPLSVVFTWVFVHSNGSLLPAVLFHACFDVALASAAPTLAVGDPVVVGAARAPDPRRGRGRRLRRAPLGGRGREVMPQPARTRAPKEPAPVIRYRSSALARAPRRGGGSGRTPTSAWRPSARAGR